MKILLHFGNVIEMEKDFIITPFFTPFTISVTIVVVGTLFLLIYDMLRWWREKRIKPIDPPVRLLPYKKFVHTLREHREVCKVSPFIVLAMVYMY